MIESDLVLPDGRVLRVYDTGGTGGTTVIWHHGTPNLGTPPAPLAAPSARLGIRWLSFDRPGYGGSSECPGRDVASAAAWARAVADHAGVDRFAVLGHSGGGPHALACAALLPDRVTAVATISGLAPPGSSWFDGMHPAAAAGLRAAQEGRAVKERFEASAEFDPEVFTPADHAALAGDWSWFDEVVGPALAQGMGGLVDDDLAFVRDWGFQPTRDVPTLVVHGRQDRMVPCAHGRRLVEATTAEGWFEPADGHISVLRRAEDALAWLVRAAEAQR
ncbi:alpha/beta fold hydrolase [Actinomycetospora sp. CA-084318]|uniref:alpha/beta fold hydrolase n=1 Tax=Actinomycetospora sp. CA-084318 TaxID=3239892 RepID=UPI003D997165